MKRRTLVSIVVVFALALGTVWFVSRRANEPIPPVAPRAVAEARALETFVALDSPAPAREHRDVATVVEPTVAASHTSVESVPLDDVPIDDRVWIEGRVEFPPGTPNDESARIAAREPPINHNFREKDLGEFAIGPDGRFRVPVPEKAWTVVLEVVGRYVYSNRARRIDVVSSPPVEVVLRPELGACARIRLVPSALALARGLVFTSSTANVHGFSRSTHAVSTLDLALVDHLMKRRAEVDERGVVELRELRPGTPKSYRACVAGAIWTEFEVPALRAGELREIEVALAAAPRLTGRVRDEQGAPIGDARVRVDTEAAGGVLSTHTTSGADGNFVAFACAEGSARLHVERAGFLAADLGPWSVSSESDIAGLDVVLPSGASIAGRVRWPDGSAAAGVDVVAASAKDVESAPPHADPFAGTGSRARTEPDGTFRFTGLDPRSHTVTARVLERIVREDRKSPRVLWIARAHDVMAPSKELVLTLSAGSVVRGRVVDPLGFPVIDAQVVANAEPAWWSDSGRTVTADADGQFELESVRAGRWRIDARRPSASFADFAHVVVSESRPNEVEIVLEPKATITGRVLDPSGATVGGSEVAVARADQSTSGRTWEKRGTTLADGTFRIDGLPPTDWLVSARRNEYARSHEVLVSATVDSPASGIDLVLRVGGVIQGVVVAADGTPIPDEPLELHRDGGSWAEARARSDEDGRFRFEHVAPGTVRVFVPWSRGASAIHGDPVIVEDGATTRVELRAR